jgi:short-subunit dehydrogenase
MTPNPLAVITGASSGIGEAFAKTLSAEGYDLIVIARRMNRLKALKNELTTKVTCIECDLADSTALEPILKRIVSRKPTLFIANAGMGLGKPFESCQWTSIENQLSVMCAAHMKMAHTLVPHMTQYGGGMIFVNSIAGLIPSANPAYGAMKSLMHRFSIDLHYRYHNKGIKTLSLCPGLTRTEFHSQMRSATGFDHAAPAWVWMSAEAVVRKALKDFRKGRIISIPGWFNVFLCTLTKIVPHRTMMRFATRFNKKIKR